MFSRLCDEVAGKMVVSRNMVSVPVVTPNSHSSHKGRVPCRVDPATENDHRPFATNFEGPRKRKGVIVPAIE